MRAVWTGLVSFTLVAAAATLTMPIGLGAAGSDGPGIAGGGRINATDIFGGYFEEAAELTIRAGVNPGGGAFGRISLVARGDFAAAWGACPYDPRCEDYPNLGTATLDLNGIVARVSSVGDTVEVSGTLTEVDHGKGTGVIFREEEVPFVITATEGSTSFVLQFCAVPPFTMDMADGTLAVQASAAPSGLLARPSVRPSALACQAPKH
jgi:hypothetical protein